MKPESRVLSRVRKILQNLGYAEHTDFAYEVAVSYGARRLWADAVLFEGNIPIALVEAEGTEAALKAGFEEARLKAITWNPEDPIPLLWVAAGNHDRCYRAVLPDRRAGVRYELLDELPARLFHPDRLAGLVSDYLERQGAASATELRYRQILQAAFRTLPGNDHQRCQSIVSALRMKPKRPSRSLRQIVEPIAQTLSSGKSDLALARAFRWLMRRYFRPLTTGRDDPVRRYGRYFTPTEIIRFIVRTINPNPGERVLDFACGSGGFLMEAAQHLADTHRVSSSDIAANLFGCDHDIGCIGVAQTVLGLLLPEKHFNLLQGDGLRLPQDKWGAESFDIVMSNPPAGTLPAEFADWKGDDKLPSDLPKLYEVAFLFQAVQMAKTGGRIGILLPDGILTNAQLRPLRKWLLERVCLQAVISLPRGLFPFTPSKMAAVIMQKRKPIKRRKSVLAEVGRQNLVGQLETVRQAGTQNRT